MDPEQMVELVAAKLHEQWIPSQRAAGIVKRYPELAKPYADLDPDAREQFKAEVRIALDAFYAAGFIVGRREVAA